MHSVSPPRDPAGSDVIAEPIDGARGDRDRQAAGADAAVAVAREVQAFALDLEPGRRLRGVAPRRVRLGAEAAEGDQGPDRFGLGGQAQDRALLRGRRLVDESRGEPAEPGSIQVVEEI